MQSFILNVALKNNIYILPLSVFGISYMELLQDTVYCEKGKVSWTEGNLTDKTKSTKCKDSGSTRVSLYTSSATVTVASYVQV